MATPQVLIMAGFDYQGSSVDFLGMAQNRRERLLARSPQLTVTILDVGSGTTTVSALTPNAAGKLVRTVRSSSSHTPVTKANYSAGLSHHTRFDKDPRGRMSITDLYDAIQTIGANRASSARR